MAARLMDTATDGVQLQAALAVASELLTTIGADRVSGVSVITGGGEVKLHLTDPTEGAAVAQGLGLETEVDYPATSSCEAFTVWKGQWDGCLVALFGERTQQSLPVTEP